MSIEGRLSGLRKLVLGRSELRVLCAILVLGPSSVNRVQAGGCGMICGNLLNPPGHPQYLSPPIRKDTRPEREKSTGLERHTVLGCHGNPLSTQPPASSPNVYPRDTQETWNKPLDPARPQEYSLPSLPTRV